MGKHDVGLLLASGMMLVGAWFTAPARAQPAEEPAWERLLRTIYYDYVDEQGRLAGGRVTFLAAPPVWDQTIPAPVTSGPADGPPENRIDLVTVGDGYTASQLGIYAGHVNASLATLFNREPFYTYSTFFNVHRVDVTSNESGVDHDPTCPIWRDTAMDMGFWCGAPNCEGIERLLCVDVGKAYSFANNAPDVDLVLAVANSSKYGGAGYLEENLATVAGGNGWAPDIAIHEFGHSLGNLADEYDYGGPTTYTGPEPPERNVSILTASQMAAAGTKWADWLGENYPQFDGLVWTYEGAYYSVYGIYRPTVNSEMRSLARPFNLPSVEGLVIEMYKIVRPIDDSTPTSQTLNGTEIVFVDPADPVGHALDIEWVLDGAPLAGATGQTLNLTQVPLTLGPHVLSVVVTDNTWFVRDETARATWLTESRSWTLAVVAVLGDLNCDGVLNAFDIDPFVLALTNVASYQAAYPNCNIHRADCNGDGQINGLDIDPFVDLLTGG